MAATHLLNRTCGCCSKPVSDQGKTGYCRTCCARNKSADPASEARRLAAVRKRFEDPAVRAKAAAEIHRRHMAARADPVKREKLDRNIWAARSKLDTPQARAALQAARAENGRKRHETVMAWCPVELRAEYKRLVISKRLLAADARAVIEGEIKARRERMSPFERQMEKVRNGAGISTKVAISRAEHAFTLGGVAPEGM